MQKIADSRGDPMSRFHNALYAGDVMGRINVLKDVGLCMWCFERILCFVVLTVYCRRSSCLFDCQDQRAGRRCA